MSGVTCDYKKLALAWSHAIYVISMQRNIGVIQTRVIIRNERTSRQGGPEEKTETFLNYKQDIFIKQ